MTKEEKETIEEFLVNVADCTNKIDYIAYQASVIEEEQDQAVEIIKDYNAKIIELSGQFNEWLVEEGKKAE